MSTEFKVGDRVVYQGHLDAPYGREARVAARGGLGYRVDFDDGSWLACVPASDLRLVERKPSADAIDAAATELAEAARAKRDAEAAWHAAREAAAKATETEEVAADVSTDADLRYKRALEAMDALARGEDAA